MDPLVVSKFLKAIVPAVVPILTALGIQISPDDLLRFVEALGTLYAGLSAFEGWYRMRRNKRLVVPK